MIKCKKNSTVKAYMCCIGEFSSESDRKRGEGRNRGGNMRRGEVKGEIAVSSKESDGKRMLMGEIKKRPRLLLAFSLPPSLPLPPSCRPRTSVYRIQRVHRRTHVTAGGGGGVERTA